jgi:hypothetical protein
MLKHAANPCIHASMHPCSNTQMHPCIHAQTRRKPMHPCIHAQTRRKPTDLTLDSAQTEPPQPQLTYLPGVRCRVALASFFTYLVVNPHRSVSWLSVHSADPIGRSNSFSSDGANSVTDPMHSTSNKQVSTKAITDLPAP